ncbi:MAG: diacylglyceryl transferase, partial [Oscillospiraceae bacterium]|nr:diacylglyceryl transferase [Oscillospiraceae bacterium]
MVIIMHVHLNVFGLELPGYGTAIMIGIVLASLIGGIHIKRRGLDINDFIILETIGVFFGFLG